jgi:transcriptional regulator with XRE-family HTH domain
MPRAIHPEIATRMRALRLAFGPAQIEFCRRYRFSTSQWSNYEAGFKPSLAVAEQLVAQIDGLTLDWIYFGKTGGLTIQLMRTLDGAAILDRTNDG